MPPSQAAVECKGLSTGSGREHVIGAPECRQPRKQTLATEEFQKADTAAEKHLTAFAARLVS